MSQDLIEELRSLVTIASLAGTRATRIECPFHGGSGPDMALYHDTNRWRCFSACDDGKTHDIFDWVMKERGVEFGQAVKILADEYGLTSRPNEERVAILTEAQRYYHQRLMETPKARAYMNARGFSDEHLFIRQIGWADKRCFPLEDMAKLRSVGLCDHGMNGIFPWFRSRIVFPIYDIKKAQINMQGRLVESMAYHAANQPKYLALPDNVELKGRSIFKSLGGEEILDDKNLKFTFMCEGVPDRETFFAWRLPAVNLYGHTGFEYHAHKLQNIDLIYSVMDPDAASQSKIFFNLYKLQMRIPNTDIRNVKLDTDGLDINAWAMKDKPIGEFLSPYKDEAKIDALREMCGRSLPLIQDLIDTWGSKPHLIQPLAQLIAVTPDRERWVHYLADKIGEFPNSVDLLVRVLTPEEK